MGSRLIDLSGKIFGRLTVQSVEPGRANNHRWNCTCDCGRTTAVQGGNLRTGHTKSCGECGETEIEMAARFLNKVQLSDAGCWNWIGARLKNRRTGLPGYGQFMVQGKCIYSHRFAWRLLFSDPGELYVLHRCDNPACVRPDHLFIGTHQDNMQDMARKGRWGNQTRRALNAIPA